MTICENCGEGCKGFCQIEIRNLYFAFNSQGMVCLCEGELTDIYEIIEDDLNDFYEAASRDLQTRESTTEERNNVVTANSWPKAAYVIDNEYCACIGSGDLTCIREATEAEIAVFILACQHSLQNNQPDTCDNEISNDKISNNI